MLAAAEGGWAGCCQMAWTFKDSVSGGRTGVSLAVPARTVPAPSSSSSFGGRLADCRRRRERSGGGSLTISQGFDIATFMIYNKIDT
jgi:hypothetical protein